MEPPRHDELPDGEQGPELVQELPEERAPNGHWAKGAKTSASRGGKARKGKPKLTRLALTQSSRSLHRVLVNESAANVGGGTCSAAASLMLRWAADKTDLAEKAKNSGDFESFRKLTESARMDMLYAREHQAKDARDRKGAAEVDPLSSYMLVRSDPA